MITASHQKLWKKEVEHDFLSAKRKALSTLNSTPSEIILEELKGNEYVTNRFIIKEQLMELLQTERKMTKEGTLKYQEGRTQQSELCVNKITSVLELSKRKK